MRPCSQDISGHQLLVGSKEEIFLFCFALVPQSLCFSSLNCLYLVPQVFNLFSPVVVSKGNYRAAWWASGGLLRSTHHMIFPYCLFSVALFLKNALISQKLPPFYVGSFWLQHVDVSFRITSNFLFPQLSGTASDLLSRLKLNDCAFGKLLSSTFLLCTLCVCLLGFFVLSLTSIPFM